MRCEIPSRIINEESINQAVVLPEANSNYDINIFSKHFKPQEMFGEVQQCLDRGSTVVFDICDNHFNRDAKEVYLYICKQAHVITCNTEQMKKAIKENTGRDAFVVSDPITFPKGNIRVNRNKNPKILWFGHASNISPVFNQKYKLTCISNFQPTKEEEEQFPHIRFAPWGLGIVENEIKNFDIVVLPTAGLRHWISTKSPNRAVDSLFSGKFVITDNEQIFGELKDYIWIGDMKEGLKYYLDNPTEVYNKLIEGQQFVADRYNHKEIFNQWKIPLSLT